jgi:hypothetical protein
MAPSIHETTYIADVKTESHSDELRIKTNLHTVLFNLCSGRLCRLVVRVPGYRTEMYCVSCEVRTEFIYVM